MDKFTQRWDARHYYSFELNPLVKLGEKKAMEDDGVGVLGSGKKVKLGKDTKSYVPLRSSFFE